MEGLPKSYDFEESLCIASQHFLHVSRGDVQRFEAGQVPLMCFSPASAPNG